jgi:hypothetical protein
MTNIGKIGIKAQDTDTSNQKNIDPALGASHVEPLSCSLMILILCQMTALHGQRLECVRLDQFEHINLSRLRNGGY